MEIGHAGFPTLPRDSHENENQFVKTKGNRTGMVITQMGMGTLIINMFPFSHKFPSKICI